MPIEFYLHRLQHGARLRPRVLRELADGQQRVEGELVRRQAVAPHAVEELPRLVRVARTHARHHHGVVRRRVHSHIVCPHLLQQLERARRALARQRAVATLAVRGGGGRLVEREIE
jgi:hypothetical protein